MDRGCICCSLRNDIVKALHELQDRSQVRKVAYDNILLETTGLADPAPVAFTFFSNTWISSNYRLDSILCLVDAQHVARHLEDASSGDINEAVNQIAFADIILLNKIDLVSPDELEKARELVRSINVTADLIEVQLNASTSKDKASSLLPSWDRLMGINSFSIERALQVDPGFMDSDSDEDENITELTKTNKRRRTSAVPSLSEHQDSAVDVVQRQHDTPDLTEIAVQKPCSHEGPCTETCPTDAELNALINKQKQQELHAAAIAQAKQRQPKRRRKKLHDVSGVGSVGITARGPLDKYRFNAFMRDLLSERARDIFRCKGVLCVHGQEHSKFVFQGVHETVCFGPAEVGWPDGEVPLNQIVFIGRNLDRRDLVEGFRSCVWVPLPDGWKEHFDAKTGQPYYVDGETGMKQWDRPTAACALVKSSETSHQQPSQYQPRTSG